MVPVTHPTELASGEAATFQFLLDGKPAADLSVSAVNGGVRYRDGIQQLDLTTDAEGKVTITWPDAGMWWVNVASGGGRSAAGPGGSAPQASDKAEQPLAAGNLPGGEGAPRPIAPPRPRPSYSLPVEGLPSETRLRRRPIRIDSNVQALGRCYSVNVVFIIAGHHIPLVSAENDL